MNDVSDQPSYQTLFDELTAFGSSEAKKPELLDAKAEYARLTGEIFPDDAQVEMRMASFLDYYLYDRRSPSSGLTPAEQFLAERAAALGPEKASAYRGFTETIHGLFEVRKLAKGVIRLRDLSSAKDFDVTERRQLAGLEKGDLIEARLIPFEGVLLFSVAFCCHPKAAFKSILSEVKRRKKKEPDRPAKDLVFECSKMALKVDRYRQIAVEKIYDFVNKKI